MPRTVPELIEFYKRDAEAATDVRVRDCCLQVAKLLTEKSPDDAVAELRTLQPPRHTTTDINNYIPFATYGVAAVLIEASQVGTTVDSAVKPEKPDA